MKKIIKKIHFLLLFSISTCFSQSNQILEIPPILSDTIPDPEINIPRINIKSRINELYKEQPTEKPTKHQIKKAAKQKIKKEKIRKIEPKPIIFKEQPKKPRVYQRGSRKRLSPENARFYGFGR